jgi:phosphoribosylaminoimidazole (AIR) synthetase
MLQKLLTLLCDPNWKQKREQLIKLAQIYEKMVEESDQAKQLLRKAGYGVTGTGLLETVKECLPALNNQISW